jgi:hypothetical protein
MIFVFMKPNKNCPQKMLIDENLVCAAVLFVLFVGEWLAGRGCHLKGGNFDLRGR